MNIATPRVIPPNPSGTRLVMVAPPPEIPGPSSPRLQAGKRGLKSRLVRLSPGQVIPGTSWRITRWLGEGNMGVVYEARHVEIDRRAAIKIVAASLADGPAAVQDFRAEASASAKIGSPNIVDVFDFAALEDGRLMMAMEFVPGRSLYDIYVEEGRLAPERLIGLFRQVCKGLQAAHEAGLVHRDIKPENIMVGEIAGRRDTVKLVDFGIAMILGEHASRHAGTPYYMPPEGLLSGAIDGRYDIYSVGCVMYEMLAGKPPFVDRSLDRVLQMHMYEPVPELVTDDARVPRKLIEVIERCLAKTPEERYESMAELEAALCEAQIEGKLRTTWDDLALPAIDEERRAKLQAKMPSRLIKKGVSGWWLPVLLAFGVVVGVLFVWPLLKADPLPTPASAQQSSAVEDLTDRVHESAALAYYVYPPVDDPRADTAYKLLIELESLASDEAHEAASVLRAELASTLVRLGDEIWAEPGGEPFALDFYVQAIMFDPAIEPARTRASLSPGELLTLRRKAGTGDFTQQELIAVEPLLALADPDPAAKHARLEAIKVRHRSRRRASATQQLDALIGVETEPSNSARPNQGLEIVAIDEPSEAVPPSAKSSADALVAKANKARKAERLQTAEKLYHQALRVEQQRVDALTGLGWVYFEQAKYAKAVTYYDLAVRRSSRDAALRIALGDAYVKTLDYRHALVHYERAKALGSGKADERIARIEQRTGR